MAQIRSVDGEELDAGILIDYSPRALTVGAYIHQYERKGTVVPTCPGWRA
jgi:hypothetical protein